MSAAVESLEPKLLWNHFAAISGIPRASEKEARAREYVLALAGRLGLEAVQDKVGNTVVRKPARPGREGAAPAALQCHLDMVCEKNEGVAHNFDADPIRLVREGDWLRADGTTLGADNGMGVAAALAVMESGEISHGPLEFVFTIDEESGLTGAAEFPGGLLRAHYFLNLDGEEENTLCIGCAGGVNTVARRAVAMRPSRAAEGWRLRVFGLQGGHSGIDIHKGRGNALRILGRALQTLLDRLPVEVGAVEGGSKRNAIPREASAALAADAAHAQELQRAAAEVEAEIRSDLGAFDPGVRVTMERAAPPGEVLSDADAALIASLLASQHHGVLAMSPDVPGLVQTSTNLAIVSVKDGAAQFDTSQRSPIRASKLAAARMVAALFRMGGFEVEHSGDYPGWKPEPKSDIVRLAQAVHEEVLGNKPELMAVHAGLECGVIGEKYPGMQTISFGPHIVDVHSPSEKLKISSVEPFWRFLGALLERI
ncbi:MAG TPA: aminoacyl-histidine dipeptidase [Bryobacteraceae bacterium]|nr:aminoacyl-histidine dipeptidase [Bryobacteraceae bacterium]